MNIVLIGMRGSGKTTVGRILAAKLRRKFVEMDDLVCQRMDLTIPQIVKIYGWEKFRSVESDIADELSYHDNIINATGGGVVTVEGNVKSLKRTGTLVWLKADVDTLLERTRGSMKRPPLHAGKTEREDLEITLTEREPLYQEAADVAVDTVNKKPSEVAGEIVKLLTEQGSVLSG